MKQSRGSGFTLVELIVVIVIMGIIAVSASSRFFDNTTFDEKFTYDEVKSALKYANKRALATGCDIAVAISADQFAVNMRSGCRTGGYTLDVPAPGLPDQFMGNSDLPDGVSITSTYSPIIFNRRGQATTSAGTATSANITVGARRLTVIGESGLVYDPTE